MARGDRSPTQRSISFSCPKSLVAQIDALAQAEKRTRSNWIVKELESLVAKGSSKILSMDLPRAAEPEGEYKPKKKRKTA
jgi:hypothetical protein